LASILIDICYLVYSLVEYEVKEKHDFPSLNMRESDKKSKYNISYGVILIKTPFSISRRSSVDKPVKI
jgi:hypothetical protein